MDYIAHHGVKGMKWGVRKAEKKASRSQNKINMFEKKINSSEKRGVGVVGRKINDRRRGRVAQIKLKQEHRAAKANFKKVEGTKKEDAARDRLNKARVARLKNVAQPNFGVSTTRRGTYNRHRKAGKTVVASALQSGAIVDTVWNSKALTKNRDSGERIADAQIKKLSQKAA